MKTLIKNVTILTMIDDDQPITGDILIEGDKIKKLGTQLTDEVDEVIQGQRTELTHTAIAI
jgi:5-methylthioadenosine/S-adenosylhomocysteine deaminase